MIGVSKIPVGLITQSSFLKDSYMVTYFDALDGNPYIKLSMPLYFFSSIQFSQNFSPKTTKNEVLETFFFQRRNKN
jgi:hypothetical protein